MSHLIKAEHLKIDPPVIIDCHKPSFTQNWVLVSFVSPEDRIKQRFIYEANRFLYNDINKQLIDITSNISKNINASFNTQIDKKIEAYKSSTDPSFQAAANILEETRKELLINEDEQVNNTLYAYRIDQQEILDRFETYKTLNNNELEGDFNKEYTNETSVRGFKVRGVFEELDEARAKADQVRKQVESFVHTFVAPVGYWCPFDPNADAVQDQEYMVKELNEMMEQKKRNEEERNDFFEKRKQQLMVNNTQKTSNLLKEKLAQRLKEQKTKRTKI